MMVHGHSTISALSTLVALASKHLEPLMYADVQYFSSSMCLVARVLKHMESFLDIVQRLKRASAHSNAV